MIIIIIIVKHSCIFLLLPLFLSGRFILSTLWTCGWMCMIHTALNNIQQACCISVYHLWWPWIILFNWIFNPHSNYKIWNIENILNIRIYICVYCTKYKWINSWKCEFAPAPVVGVLCAVRLNVFFSSFLQVICGCTPFTEKIFENRMPDGESWTNIINIPLLLIAGCWLLARAF